MFGYVRPLKGELKVWEYESYKAVYCGICRSLGKRLGFAARFTVNYDLTFYAALLMSLTQEGNLKKCRCPGACMLKKKNAYTDCQAIDRAADLSVILYYFGLLDKKRDGGFWKGLLSGFLAVLLKPGVKKARAANEAFYRQAEARLQTLSVLEKENSKSLDKAADTFASLLAGAVPTELEPQTARPLEQILYNVGRFIYIADAYDDFADDRKNGAYNPIARRYALEGDSIPESITVELDILVKNCENLTLSAVSLLKTDKYGGIAENILYLGLPAVWQSVKDGKFNPKKNKRNGRVYE